MPTAVDEPAEANMSPSRPPAAVSVVASVSVPAHPVAGFVNTHALPRKWSPLELYGAALGTLRSPEIAIALPKLWPAPASPGTPQVPAAARAGTRSRAVSVRVPPQPAPGRWYTNAWP